METTHEIICPFCGAQQFIFIDVSVHHQQYIEDCQVCCQPIEMDILVEDEDEVRVAVEQS